MAESDSYEGTPGWEDIRELTEDWIRTRAWDHHRDECVYCDSPDDGSADLCEEGYALWRAAQMRKSHASMSAYYPKRGDRIVKVDEPSAGRHGVVRGIRIVLHSAWVWYDGDSRSTWAYIRNLVPEAQKGDRT